MSVIMYAGTSANAGKTVFTRATCRLLANDGVTVAPFKPIAVTSRPDPQRGIRLDFRLWLLGAAARWPVGYANGPVLVQRDRPDSGQLWIGGEPVGAVPLLAEDTPLLEQLPGALTRTLRAVEAACARLTTEAEVVVVEGSGNCTDLVGSVDVANEYVARRTSAAVVLVAGAHTGGAIAGLHGSLLEMSAEFRSFVVGMALNDLRGGDAILAKRAQRLADEFGLAFLGALPHCSIYDNIPPGQHSSLGDDEAEYDWLAEFFATHLDMATLRRVVSDPPSDER